MNTTDSLVADVEADILAAEGAFHVHGIYYAIFGDADRACREEFDQFLAEAEIARAQATLQIVEA
ncbi:MAG TPA: hypothetical protein VNV25_22350 [Gemmatimonadaceae bacterium]|jgi:hypothetical protein|nr:hypothetical protein [Gemmatimonadaceae bacterium]